MSEVRQPGDSQPDLDFRGEGDVSADRPGLDEAHGSIGAYLRGQRELRGISMEELASLTRIPMRSLERLEAGRFDDQPDGFVRGFVRTVGIGLGLDPDVTVARMLPEPASDGRPGFRLTPRASRAFIGFALVLALVLAVLSLREWSLRRALPTPIERAEVVRRQDPVRDLAEAALAAGQEASPVRLTPDQIERN